MSFGALLSDCWRVCTWKLPVLFALTFLSAALEGVTLAALLPLLSSLNSAVSQGIPDRVSVAFDKVLSLVGQPASTAAVGALVALLIITSACVYLAQSFVLSRLHAAYIASWQRRLLRAFLEADYSFFGNHRAADLITAISTESVRLGLAFIQANLIVASILFVVIQVVVAVFVAPVIVGLLAVFAGLLFLITRPLAKRALAIGRAITALNADLQADSSELLSGAKFIKATATEERAITRLANVVYHLQETGFRNSFDGYLVRAAFEYPGGLAMVALIVAAPLLFGLDISVVIVVVAMFVRLFPRITGLRQSLQILNTCIPALGIMTALMDDAKRQTEPSADADADEFQGRGPASIALENVSVTVDKNPILKDVSFAIPKGAFVAITGVTGSGKTTLLDCILGLRKPATGRVLIDGRPLGELSAQAWRSHVGYLGQEPLLFNASIADNLRWIRPETTDAEIEAALKLAAAADFAASLPQGIETRVGDHGSRLSGGERQRIALARALIGSPRVLVLDEATSALDTGTEEAVTKVLGAMKGRMTILAITHRPALVREADVVIRLEAGRLADDAADLRAVI